MRQRRGARRGLSCLLALCMLLALLPVSARAEETTPDNRTIALFDPLKETQVYCFRGTPQAELDLPKTLEAAIYTISPDTEQITIENITWAAPDYDSETAGDYVFTASAEGYDCAEGVSWPTLTVTLTVPLSIAVQPVNQEAAEGEPVTFTLAAEGKNLSYQWQRGLPGPEADFTFDRATADSGAFVWTEIDGEQEASYSFSAALEDLYDARYRCAVTDGADTLFSNEVFVSEAVKSGARNAAVYWLDEGARATNFADGDGSEENPYQISSAAELGYMAYLLGSDSSYRAKCFKLTQNIDLAGHDWAPVGYAYTFQGVFDGGNHTISNMTTTDNKLYRTGLFGTINTGIVKNVILDSTCRIDVNYAGSSAPTGFAAIVGVMSGDGVVENCHSAATVRGAAPNGYPYVGGVVGCANKGTIRNCSNSGSVTGGVDAEAGGIAGLIGNTGETAVLNCSNSGAITIEDAAYSSYAGGVVGDVSNGTSTVRNCYNSGSISGKGSYSAFGGIVGTNSGTVANCYTTGTITVTGGNRRDGVYVGNNSGTVGNGYYLDSVVSGMSAIGYGSSTDVLSFDSSGVLAGTVTIGGTEYSGLRPALSAWVDTQTADYWYWTGPAAAPVLTKDPPPATFVVTVTVQKDGAAWDDHGKTFKLVSGGTTVTNLNSVVNGTYDVYVGDVDTGEDVEVNGAAASATVDYYTVTFYDGDTAYASGTPQAPQIVLKGGKAATPTESPIKQEFVFDKWVTENNGTTAFDFANTSITAATGVHVKWTYDTSTEVSTVLKVNEDGPYYNGGSVILIAEVTNKSTHAPVTEGTVQFYKGDTSLGDVVGYAGGDPPKGFYLSVVCGQSASFPYLAVGDNVIKAVYTPGSGTDVASDPKTLAVLSEKDGSAYVGTVTVDGLSASSSGVVPVQFTVANNGGDVGITADQFTVTSTKDGQPFADFTVSYNETKTIAYVHVTGPGSYEFTATLSNGSYAAIKSVNATVAPSYAVTVAVNKDGAAWSGHGKTFTLQQDAEPPIGLTEVPPGTYRVLDGGADTGKTVTMTDRATTVTLDYYTVSFSVTDAGRASGSTVSAVYDGAALTSGSVVLGSKQLVITASGAGADRYSYLWSGSGTNGESTAVLTVEALAQKVDAVCTVTGSNSSSASSSDSSHTTSEKNPDGSTTTTVTKPDGTVTETTKAPDGTKTVVETKKDGTVTQTVNKPDGTTTETVTTAKGNQTYTEQRPDGTKISADSPKSGEATAKVTLPESVGATVVSFPVTDGTVVLRVLPDGTEEPVPFSLVVGGKAYIRLDGDAELKVETRAGLFDDMDGHWAEEPADFTGARELFEGTAPRYFAPEQPMTRAMLTTVLYRMDGAPDGAGGGAPFSDVDSGAWYASGVAWAVENGIASGTGGGLFGAGRSITRQELAVMLWNYAKYDGIDVSIGEDTNILSYADVGEAGEWAIPALRWACGAGIIDGTTDNRLAPRASATRAEAAAMLERFITLAVKSS